MATKKSTDLQTMSDSPSLEVGRFVEAVTPESLRGVNIERVVSLEAGQMIRGEYMGPGPEIETTDPVTGEVRNLGTHRFKVADGVALRVISSHQLSRELPQHVGKRVRLMKVGQVQTRKGFRVTDWVIGVEP